MMEGACVRKEIVVGTSTGHDDDLMTIVYKYKIPI